MTTVEIWGARAGQTQSRLFEEIRKCREAGQRVLLLVPEQYTLQAERELLEQLHLPGLLDLDVLSPRRLGRRIRESAGHSPKAALDESGRRMALAQALSLKQEELHYYRRVALSPGLPEKLSTLLMDFQRTGLSSEEFAAYAEELPSGALKAKAHDLLLLWQTYDMLIAERFQDEPTQQFELVERLPESGLMRDAAVFVYQFDMLPTPLCILLATAAPECTRMVVAFTMDKDTASDGHVFASQRRSAAELTGWLRQRGIPVQWKWLPSEPDGRDEALRHLEAHLFARDGAVYPGDASALTLHAAANPYAEAAFAAQTLQSWHERGIPWQYMAVALADAQSMAGILAVTLQSAGIPCYQARKDSAARHGLSRMLVGALRCISGGFLRADVLQVAKSGFSSLTRDEADSLENYAITHGINRGKWLRPFPYGDDAADMDELRVRLISPVQALRDALRRAKTAGDSVEAIFRFLEDTNAYDRLMAREEALLSRGMAAEATQNRQVWTILMTLLDQLYALLSTQKANQRDLARFVESGLTGASISSLPPQPDTVMIGEAGHLMTGRIDALLVMGMQDGALGSTADSLLSETERRTLCDLAQRAIGLTQQETCALRQSDFYRTLSLPRRFLTVTCSQGGQDGTAFRPAGLLEDMTQLFPHMVVSGGVLANDVAPLSPAMALDALPHHLRQAVDTDTPLPEQWANVLRWLYFDPEWHSRCQAVLDALNRHGTAIFLSRDHTRRLFTQDKVSISRLEGFAQCPYRHFVNYGLKPVIRREYEFDPADVGDFYHAAMEGYAALALKEPDFPDLPDEKIHALMDTVLLPLTTAWADGPLNETPSLRLQGEKYRRTVHRAAWMFTHHAQHSRFRTVGEEVVFGEEDGLPPVVLTLHDGRKIALRGKIDRIDRWEGDEGVYLLVSDYKSSHRDIDPTRLWYGLQLQLLLYLQAACEGLDGNPAGAFYFTIQDPMVDTADVKESAEKAIAKKLHLKGIVLADVDVVEALDSNPGYSFTKIFNADSSVASSSDGYTSEEMAALLAHAKKMAAELADRIRSGEITPSPAVIRDWNACQWCDCAGVCKLDTSIPGHEKRELPPLKKQDLLTLMANDTDAPGNEADTSP